MLDEITYPTAAAAITADDFSLEKHRRIYRRMSDLYARGEHIDRITVANELNRHGELESVDGLGYMASLDDGLPHFPKIESYLRIIQEKAALRRMIFTYKNLMARCLAGGERSEEILESARKLLDQISTRRQDCCTISDLPLMSDCASEISYLVEPVLARSSVVALTGDSGSGKSTLAFALARDAGVPVLILDRENPLPVVADRVVRLRIKDGPNFRIWGGWLSQPAPAVDSPIVLDWVATCEPKPIVVVDSLAAFHNGDQNDAGEMRAFMNGCRRIADKGATALLIHHSGKADTATDYRGSSDFKAAIDVGFHVVNFGYDGRLDKLVLRCFKSRFGFAGSLSYRYDDGRFTCGDSGDARQTVNEQLIDLLRAHPGVTAGKFDDLANGRGLGRNRARSFLSDGVLSGLIRRETGSKNIKRYSLAAEENA